MSKASQEAKRSAKEITKSFEEVGASAEKLLQPFGTIGQEIGAALGGIGATIKGITSSMSGLTGALGEAGIAAGLAGGAIAALGLAGAGIAVFAAKSADEFHEMSEKTGVSVEALSSLSYAAKQAGVSTETLVGGLEKMNKSVFAASTASVGAVNAYTRLGVSVKDAGNNIRPTQDILVDLADKFQKMGDTPARGALAMQLFGKSGAEMVPFLIQGKEGIAELTAEADKLGITISGKTADQSHVFEQTLNKIQGALVGASNTVLKEMLPALQGFVDFIVSDLKDPSSSFREIGRVVLDVVVPAFKVLAGAIGIITTAFDYMSAVLTGGFQFITTLVYALGNAVSDIGHGNFKQAAAGLKESFSQGLDTFVQGVAKETAAADQKLSTLFGALLHPDTDSSTGRKAEPKNTLDTNPADKSNPVSDRIKKLQEAATAEGLLANQINLSAAAIRVQNEQNEISKVLLELGVIAKQKHLTVTDAETEAVKRAIVSNSEFKAAFDIRDAVEKATLSLSLHIAETNLLSDAYTKGGQAILDAQVAVAAAPFTEKIKELETSMASAKETLGENSKEYLNLAAALNKAKTELDVYTQSVVKSKQADAGLSLAQGTESIRQQLAGLAILGSAIGGTTEELRQAAVQAQLTQYAMSHVAVDTSSQQWKDYAAAVDAASKATEENRIKQQAESLDLLNTFQNKIKQLEDYRNALSKNAANSLAINAAEQDATLSLTKAYDQLLLKVGTAKDGVTAFFRDFTNDGVTAAQQVYNAMNVATTGIEKSLTNLVVTGKGGFAALGQSIESSIVGSGVHDLVQKATKGIAGVFNVDLGLGGKRDGNTATNALFVQSVDATGNVAGSGPLPLGPLFGSNQNLSSVTGSGGGGFLGGASSLLGSLGKIGGGIGGFFGKIGGLFGGLLGSFGGFLAGGGSAVPGKSYIVGENGPEVFRAPGAGTILPGVGSDGASRVVNVGGIHIHGATDLDSFRRSEAQIAARMGSMMQRAQQRLG
jgi:Lambda phage tail tape-measure protein (Tape_meas_lam_C)